MVTNMLLWLIGGNRDSGVPGCFRAKPIRTLVRQSGCGRSGTGDDCVDPAEPGELFECPRRGCRGLRDEDGLRSWISSVLRQGRRAACDPAGRERKEAAGGCDCRGERGVDRLQAPQGWEGVGSMAL